MQVDQFLSRCFSWILLGHGTSHDWSVLGIFGPFFISFNLQRL